MSVKPRFVAELAEKDAFLRRRAIVLRIYCLSLSHTHTQVVNTGPFSLFLLRKHFITEKFKKKKSGDVNDEANFSFFILPLFYFALPRRSYDLWDIGF
jgi:hypothetical protein